MNLFTYGSLMFPEVWNRVTGQPLTGLPATLHGHAARRLRGESYPALVPDPSAKTHGILYADVTPESMQRLDQFEGLFYERVCVTIITEAGQPQEAWTYHAANPSHPDILPEPWDAVAFASTDLQTFLAEDPGFDGSRD
jgi:gamma-glutamylcyclotransferase (GGCT)/AIG2-like uncharacterized protein YtfP